MCSSNVMNSGNIFRTEDVDTKENCTFESLLLSKNLLKGLQENGLYILSPVQLKAIPIGKCGFDLVVQAKSGTGKTCVFSIIILENLLVKVNHLQALILAPIREIAYQIMEVLSTIGSYIPNLSCHSFIGGLSVSKDKIKLKNCQIAVGTPGRIKQLLKLGVMHSENIRFFVLDEADKLMEESFRKDVLWICSKLPENKQMMALSATYPDNLDDLISHYMKTPQYILLHKNDPTLLGITQNVYLVPYHSAIHVILNEKQNILHKLLSIISFNQCLIFCNYQTRAETVCKALLKNNWSATYLTAAQQQHIRLQALENLKTYNCRILVSTDVSARGIDVINVNLVINFDIPWDTATYIHRIGRGGRFGTISQAVSIAVEGEEYDRLCNIISESNSKLSPIDLNNICDRDASDFISSKSKNLKHLKTLLFLEKDKKLQTTLSEIVCHNPAKQLPSFSEIKEQFNNVKIKEDCACNFAIKQTENNVQEIVKQIHSYLESKKQNFKEAYTSINSLYKSDSQLYTNSDTFELEKLHNGEPKNNKSSRIKYKLQFDECHNFKSNKPLLANNIVGKSLLYPKNHAVKEDNIDFSVLSSCDNENECSLKTNFKQEKNQSENLHCWNQWYNNLNWSLYVMKVFIWHREYFRYMLNMYM